MISTLHAVCENPPLHEIHRSKISLHHAKADYDYPTIRLPHTLSTLAGLPTHIYQTVHQGALAFLVVVSSSNKSEEESQNKSENPAISLRPPYLHGGGRVFESPSAEASLIDRVVISGFRYSRNPALILKPEISDRQSFRALARANDSLLIDAIH